MEDRRKEYFDNNLSENEIGKVEAHIADFKAIYPEDFSFNEECDDELIGVDDDEIAVIFQKSEKISEKICKNVLNAHSIEMNNKNIQIMETTKFTATELSIISNRHNEIHSAANESLSLKENLVAYYMSTDSDLSQEEADRVVTGLMSGVEDLTTKFNTAIEEGWNPEEHIGSMVAKMSTQQRYDFLVNAISIANTLNTRTIGDMPDIQASINETIEKLKSGHIEVTETLCDELQSSLSEMLTASPLMLSNTEKIKEMMNAASEDGLAIIDFASAQYDDYRLKNEMALAAWIEHKKGSLTSLPTDIVPEALGVSIAAGVEEAHIIEEMTSGSRTLEWGIRGLKILGAVALVCFLGYIALLGMTLMMGAFFEASILIMGTSTVAIFTASALSLIICCGYLEIARRVGAKLLDWSGEAYDWLMNKFKNDIYPTIKSSFTNLVSTIQSLFQGSHTSQQTLG